MKSAVLAVDDDPSFLDIITSCLSPDFDVEGVSTLKQASRRLEEKRYDMILLDLGLPDGDGLSLVPHRDRVAPGTPVVVITMSTELRRAVEAIRSGVEEYVTKDLGVEEVSRVIRKVSASLEQARELAFLRDQLTDRRLLFSEMSSAMKILHAGIESVAPLSTTVLIQGESGTGKELVAREIHRTSATSSGPFVSVNLAAIPADLGESILFGHERGSFTNAHQQHIGKFEMAAGGTLFLDEVGSMPLSVQVKLLRVLQENEFERLGGTHPISLKARLIAATHRDLKKEVREGRFREDLFYRLNVYPITVPPLRDRPEQIPVLGKHFLHRYLREFGKTPVNVEPVFWDLLSTYAWPGNVRELENLMQRLAVINKGKKITEKDIPEEFQSGFSGDDGSLREALERYERRLLLHALCLHGGNQRAAAKHLKIPLSTFKFRVRRNKIERNLSLVRSSN